MTDLKDRDIVDLLENYTCGDLSCDECNRQREQAAEELVWHRRAFLELVKSAVRGARRGCPECAGIRRAVEEVTKDS